MPSLAQVRRAVGVAHSVVALPGAQSSVTQAPERQTWPAPQAVVVVIAPRASHSMTEVPAVLQLKEPGVQTRAVHAAPAPAPVQMRPVAVQSVVVRAVPEALHSLSTSPTHSRVPAAHVTVAQAPRATRQVCPEGHAAVAPQLRPSLAHV